jgi:hypothetical protein
MRAVKNVVATGRTTVCTIHQPSIDVFEAFDEVAHVMLSFTGIMSNLLIFFWIHVYTHWN